MSSSNTFTLRLTVLSLLRIPFLQSESPYLEPDGLWVLCRFFIAIRKRILPAGDGALAGGLPGFREDDLDLDLHLVRPLRVPDSPVPPLLFVVASACFVASRIFARPLG
ncbi:uncharacterized protein DNG_08624 [Cephalotrichum gorgonifer]|uniref:Secreted protein n=1 Tax=Cephalotrichum gorgonifer TaxID=2041049 RepID=A0AAE8N6V6_9PEZI|nr:uncharacterized protein DNG_08624 [Cephalotrichum gorgonifer]